MWFAPFAYIKYKQYYLIFLIVILIKLIYIDVIFYTNLKNNQLGEIWYSIAM